MVTALGPYPLDRHKSSIPDTVVYLGENSSQTTPQRCDQRIHPAMYPETALNCGTPDTGSFCLEARCWICG